MKNRGEVKEQFKALCQSKAHEAIVDAVVDYVYDEIVELPNKIEYHSESMGCGLEDNNITDRYEAMEYGFNMAIDALNEIVRE